MIRSSTVYVTHRRGRMETDPALRRDVVLTQERASDGDLSE
jgi:hypothetical protein